MLNISEQLVERIETSARNRELSVEEFLALVLYRQQMADDRSKIIEEQNWWMNQPFGERAKYEGKYVAVYNKQLVDHDSDRRALRQRVHSAYGDTAVLIMLAEGPRELQIISPKLDSK